MRLVSLVCGVAVCAIPSVAAAQYIYPNQGQTQQQEQFDRGQCYSWAVQQTGFDPANPQVAAGPPPQMQMYAAQQQGAMAQGRSNYERAFGACMARASCRDVRRTPSGSAGRA